MNGDRYCEICGTDLRRRRTERPSAYVRRRACSRSCGARIASQSRDHAESPMVCVCERPVPNGLGECGGCHRLVLTHSWAEGRPPVACTPTNVTEIVAGSAIWDATDRQFKFVDANPPTTATLQTVTYTDGVVDDYNKAVVLHVADNPWQASRWNSGEPLEQAS